MIVIEQLLEARARYIRQLDLHFGRGPRSFTPFQNILFPRARRLDHLIYRAIALR